MIYKIFDTVKNEYIEEKYLSAYFLVDCFGNIHFWHNRLFVEDIEKRFKLEMIK